MFKNRSIYIVLAIVFIAITMTAGCKKAEVKSEPAAKPAAPAKASAPAAETHKYNFEAICAKYVEGKKEAYKNDPYSDEAYANMQRDCVDEFMPEKAREGAISDELMETCGGREGTDWLYCFDTEKSGIIEKHK